MSTSTPRALLCDRSAADIVQFEGLRALQGRVAGCHRRHLLVQCPDHFPFEGTWRSAPSNVDLVALRGEGGLEYRTAAGGGMVRIEAGQLATVPGGTAYRLFACGGALFELYLPESDGVLDAESAG